MVPKDKVRVQVLTTDERIAGAARSLDDSIYSLEFPSDMSSLLTSMDASGLDVAVLDLRLGGFSTAKEIRMRPDGDKVALVMVCERFQDKWVCLQSGADEVVLKPLPNTTTLVNAVVSAINSRKN